MSSVKIGIAVMHVEFKIEIAVVEGRRGTNGRTLECIQEFTKQRVLQLTK